MARSPRRLVENPYESLLVVLLDILRRSCLYVGRDCRNQNIGSCTYYRLLRKLGTVESFHHTCCPLDSIAKCVDTGKIIFLCNITRKSTSMKNCFIFLFESNSFLISHSHLASTLKPAFSMWDWRRIVCWYKSSKVEFGLQGLRILLALKHSRHPWYMQP